MTDARPLREVFEALAGSPDAAGATGDPAQVLAGTGHGDLPDELVAEAIVSYADTAPVEVAAHLAPFVTAHSAVPLDPAAADPVSGLDLLATAPAAPLLDEPLPGDQPRLTDEPLPGDQPWRGDEAPPAGSPRHDPDTGQDPDFGTGDRSAAGAPEPTGLDETTGDPFGLDFGAGDPVDLPVAGYPEEPEPAGAGDFAPPAPAPAEPEDPAAPEDGLAG